jgi:transposase
LVNNSALAVIGGVSAEGGFEGYLIKPKSIRGDSFIAFVENLLLVHDPAKLALFMDNCSVHHSKIVTKFLRDLSITAIFNVPYSPEYNPIERVWAIVKNQYKR